MLNCFVFLLLVSPWLNPFATGPSLTVSPLLFSWTCALLLFGVTIWRNNKFNYARFAGLVAWAWLVAGLLSSLMGLFQYFGLVDGLEPWINGSNPGEAYANLRQRNHFASLTNIALAALIWLVVPSEMNRIDVEPTTLWYKLFGAFRWPRLILSSAAAALLMTGNAVSSSRTGLFELLFVIVCGAVWGSFRIRVLRWVLFFAIFAYALVSLILAIFTSNWLGILERFREISDPCLGRLTLWSNTIELIKQRPWMGWGWGELDYAHYVHIYTQSRFCGVMDNAHNLPLHLAAELGMPTAFLFCSFIGWLIFRRNPLIEKNSSRQLAWTVLGIIGLHSLLEYPLWYGPFQISVLLCFVVLDERYSRVNRLWCFEVGSHFRMFLGGFFCVCLFGLIFSFREYSRVSQIFLPPNQRDEDFREDTLLKIYPVLIFGNQLRFAQLTMQQLTPANASWVFHTSQQLLHYSPEPAVIEMVIQSAAALGDKKEVDFNLIRYRLAFPDAYIAWAKVHVKSDRHNVTSAEMP